MFVAEASGQGMLGLVLDAALAAGSLAATSTVPNAEVTVSTSTLSISSNTSESRNALLACMASSVTGHRGHWPIQART